MSTTAAMVFLIEAATATCAPVATARLGGGAEVEQAVLDFEEEAADPFAPTLAGSSRSTGAAPGDGEPNDAEPDPAAARCKPVPLPIA